MGCFNGQCSIEEECYRRVKMPGAEESEEAIKEAARLKLEDSRRRCRDYARRKRAELEMVRDKVVLVYQELVRMGAYSGLSDSAKEFFDVYVHREEKSSRQYPPTVYRMFGERIEPGVYCTLKDAMQKLYRGKGEISTLLRKWRTKHGLVVKVVKDDSGNTLYDRYVVESCDSREKAEKKHDVRDIMSDREKKEFREFESRH